MKQQHTIPPQQTTSCHVYRALLDPKRIEALSKCDRNVVSYEPTSFWMIFRLRGRHFRMIVLPLAILLIWDVFWAVCLVSIKTSTSETIRDALKRMEGLVTPLLVPVSFLLVFRLGRAAIRYWDARAALGKLVEVCRTTASTALVGLSVSRIKQPPNNKSDVVQKSTNETRQQIAQDFVRWLAVFPISVKNFLREGEDCSRILEIGALLSIQDRNQLLDPNREEKYAPILVLNHLRRLAFAGTSLATSEITGALWFRQLNEQIDVLTGAWGAMERINGTPLPFVYVVHLRTFLILYLLLWHLEAIAAEGWIAMIPLLLASWGLLGIEAAAVECERPFRWQSNHLSLGRGCIVVARNLAQTMENTGWANATMPTRQHPKEATMLSSQRTIATDMGNESSMYSLPLTSVAP